MPHLPRTRHACPVSLLTTHVVGRLGYYMPWALVSAVLAAIGAGLLGTLLPDSASRKWIGYQIISGTGRGFGLQMVTVFPNTLVFVFSLPVD